MRGKIYFILLAIILFAAIGSALENTDCSKLEDEKLLIVGQTLPEKIPFTNETINVYVEDKIFASLTLENKVVLDFSCVGSGKATYEIRLKSFEVVSDFIESEDFIETYKEKSDSEELIVKGITLGKKVKLFFIKFFLKFA